MVVPVGRAPSHARTTRTLPLHLHCIASSTASAICMASPASAALVSPAPAGRPGKRSSHVHVLHLRRMNGTPPSDLILLDRHKWRQKPIHHFLFLAAAHVDPAPFCFLAVCSSWTRRCICVCGCGAILVSGGRPAAASTGAIMAVNLCCTVPPRAA